MKLWVIRTLAATTQAGLGPRPFAAHDASAQQLRRCVSRRPRAGAATAAFATARRPDSAVRRALDSFLRWGYPISRLSAPRSL
jgi:hypothetical protein